MHYDGFQNWEGNSWISTPHCQKMPSTWSILLCVKSLLSTIRLDLYVVFLVLEHMRYAAGQRFFQSAALGFSSNHQCAQVPLLWSMVKKRGLPSISHNRGTSWFELLAISFQKHDWSMNSGWWFGAWILFFLILGIIIPTDEVIFFGVGIPPTSYGLW
jgi:hypothetical protein